LNSYSYSAKLEEALREILACDDACTEISYKGAPAGTSKRRSKAVRNARRLLDGVRFICSRKDSDVAF
jgi:hypothetical protein